MGVLMDEIFAYITEYGKISFEEYCILEAKDENRPKLKMSRDLKLSIDDTKKCMQELKSLPLIKDTKIDVSKLKEYQDQMRSLMKSLIDNAGCIYSFYHKDLQYDIPGYMAIESVVDDYNDKVKKVIDETEDEIKRISKKAKSKREKEDAFIKITNKRLETVQEAFKAVEATYNDFMNAVKNVKPSITDEYNIFEAQCQIFINQYQLLTGYIGSEIKNVITTMTLATLGVAGMIFIKNPLLKVLISVPTSIIGTIAGLYAGVDAEHDWHGTTGSYLKLRRGPAKTIKRNIEKLRDSVKSKD